MAIEFIEQQSEGQNSTQISFTLSGSVEVGDVVQLIHADNFYTLANLNPPGGTAVTTWVEKTDNGLPVDGGSNDNHARVWIGTVTTAGGTVVTSSDNTDHERYALMMVFRNAEFDTCDAIEVDTSETAHVAPSLTPTSGKNDDYLTCVWGTLTTQLNYTLPGSMTPTTEFDTGFNTYRGGYEQLASDSATGTRTPSAVTASQYFAVSVLMKSTGEAEPPPDLTFLRPVTYPVPLLR